MYERTSCGVRTTTTRTSVIGKIKFEAVLLSGSATYAY